MAAGHLRSVPGRRGKLTSAYATLALAGVYLLRRRGITGGSSVQNTTGFDVYLAAVPVLLGLGVGLIVLRLYPLPVRALAWLAALRRDLVPGLGFKRVARQPTITAAPTTTDMSIEKRAGAVDRMAAVLILQSFLAARAS